MALKKVQDGREAKHSKTIQIMHRLWLQTILALTLIFIPRASAVKVTDDINTDVQTLTTFGPRVAGTPAASQASNYLLQAYRKAGYIAEAQTFTYSKFEDLGSSLNIQGRQVKGQALKGSIPGRLTAPLVLVPNVGRVKDFDTTNVKGAIALVRRGEISFVEKARNAAEAGAVGLVIINSGPQELRGTLGGNVNIPVLGLSGNLGNSVLQQVEPEPLLATMEVAVRQRLVTGRNVIAHLPGVSQPSLLIGGHYDSVAGSPGANDNASGTAVVLALARHSVSLPWTRHAYFVAFDGEEDGLHGSRAFVREAKPQLIQGLKAMLNFDMVGVNSQLLVAGTPSLRALVKEAVPDISTFNSQDDSDHASFAAANVPVLFFTRGPEPNYHTPQDDTVNVSLLKTTVEVALEVVNRLVIVEPSLEMRIEQH
ncbi:MAG: M28 family peptidase [Aphanothece sp. CMT-3BRIN-NPC111]|jgi:hypothetical protein|nr:M28 family peptidase [Aphanothece sp. CMT-3BRIN-NPC111]